jgi:DNA-binding transcriptional ArsR family regulator
MDDPFWSQKSARSKSRSRILTIIGIGGRTFGELVDEVHLSRPVLSAHLRTLESEGIIARHGKGRRIEYELTEKGKGLEKLRRESIINGFQIFKQLALDPSIVDTLSEMNKLAKDDPQLFEGFMQWITDFAFLMTSDDTVSFVTRHPGEEGGRLLKERMSKKLSRSVIKHSSQSENPFDKMSIVLKAMREVITGDKTKKASI